MTAFLSRLGETPPEVGARYLPPLHLRASDIGDRNDLHARLLPFQVRTSGLEAPTMTRGRLRDYSRSVADVLLTAADDATFEKVRAHLSASPPEDAEVLPGDEPLTLVLRFPGISPLDIAAQRAAQVVEHLSTQLELPPTALKAGGGEWPESLR